MRKLTAANFMAISVALLALTLGSTAMASATPPAGSTMPLSAKLRACDFSQLSWVDAVGDARPVAHVGTTGQGAITAQVDIATAQPNTHYDVRVIQMPRASIGCAPGDPGVIVGGLTTDGVGAGSTSLQGPVASGKTGAWVIVSRPAPNSLTPAEFYTSEFVAAI